MREAQQNSLQVVDSPGLHWCLCATVINSTHKCEWQQQNKRISVESCVGCKKLFFCYIVVCMELCVGGPTLVCVSVCISEFIFSIHHLFLIRFSPLRSTEFLIRRKRIFFFCSRFAFCDEMPLKIVFFCWDAVWLSVAMEQRGGVTRMGGT